MKKVLLILICLAPLFSSAQKITHGEYFFDQDPGYGNAAPFSFTAGNIVEFTENIPLQDVQPGYHTFYYRLKDDVHGWGQTFSQPFYKKQEIPLTKIVYTFDDQTSEQIINIEPGSAYIHDDFIIDVAQLDSGMHHISFQLENANGFRSQVWVDSVRIDHSTVHADHQVSSTTREIVVYPNPNSGEFTVEFRNFEDEIRVMLFNSIGQVVHNEQTTEKQIQFHVPNLKSGMYYIKTMNNNKQFNQKIVVR